MCWITTARRGWPRAIAASTNAAPRTPTTPVDSAAMPSAEALVTDIERALRPLEVELAQAWWSSNTAASDAADERRTRAEIARRELLADADTFAALGAARTAARTPTSADPFSLRQLDLLHDAFLPHQIPADLRRRLVELETRVESTFNTFRPTMGDRRVDDNAIADVLRTSDDTGARRQAWEASKQVGAEVADDLRALARLRNESSRRLGHRDHFALALATGELDESRLLATLAEVDEVTRAPFTHWKHELDASLATRFECTVADLRP